MRWILGIVALAGCGGAGAGSVDGGGSATGDAGKPVARCEPPMLADTSTPTTTVGDGTASSCTPAALQAAATAGGTIVFACGAMPITIPVTQVITFTKETVLDGNGLVTLDGGGTSRILYLDADYNTATPRLTVQRLSFVHGKSPATGADTAQGGGAIYRDGGSLTVIDSHFDGNHAPATGQDVAGGAIYGFGGGETVIAGSTFTNNAASDGGAVGTLNANLTIVNSTFTGNAATGTGGNPGDGGCGGALYQDGKAEKTSLCGLTVRDNTAGAIGGAYFRVSNTHDGSFAMDRSTIDHNRVTPTTDGNAGGLYLEGLAIAITSSTISRNQAFYNGGIWLSTAQVQMTNVTIAENTAFGSNGGGVWLAHTPTGAMTNCTIANNHSTAANQIAGAIFGDGLTLANTVVAGNTAMYTPGCDRKRTDGTGNLQFPGAALCTASPVVADPMLGALGGVDLETMTPPLGSPAIGIATMCPPTDELGAARGEPCTAGAVEP
ncbi:choice-of-anchor Q domain-containing protein [soil metagenome]